MAYICNNCGTEMEDLVLSYTVNTPVTAYDDEVKIAVNGEPGAPHYYFYICPKCGNVQAYRVEIEEE